MAAGAASGEVRAALGDELQRLRLYNIGVGIVLVIQVIALLALSNDFSLPVTWQFASGPPGSGLFTARETLFDVRLGPAVAIFLGLAAADHLLVASPFVFGWYSRNLQRGINYARWWEYSVSASLMVVLIAQVTGITDAGALIAIFGVNAAMIFFGLMMELHNQSTAQTNWTAFILGSVVGIVPWLAIGFYLIGAEVESNGDVPNFVYGIFISLFVLFNSFAINMLLQYKRVGPWRDYLFGEKGYIALSLTAKSALAWQVFANTLVD